MKKIDHKKEFYNLYSGKISKPVIVNVPLMNYLMIDGKGHPSEKEFQEACSTLYPVTYTIKFMLRPEINIDYKVMPLEVMWTVNRTDKTFTWTMLQMQPEYVTKSIFQKGIEKLLLKKRPSLIEKLRFEKLDEGLCGQIIHKGPYEKMNDTFKILTDFLESEKYAYKKDSHDIYFNSPIKTKPENLRTMIRTQIKKSL
ncbi:GyrI-like domain-containing protein [bacterium]|nr:GyrI-like domain-containing protein [bacterium]